MKLTASITLLSIACIFVFLLFSGLECNDTNNEPKPDDPPEPEKCGEKVVDRKWIQDFTTEGLNEICSFNEEEKIANFGFSAPSQQNVCPHEHVKVKIQVIGYNGAHYSHYRFGVDILFGILFSYKLGNEHFAVSHDANYVYFDAVADFSVKPSAGDNPGWYAPFIDIHVSQRDNVDDAIYDFEHAIYMIKIDWEHFEYKEPEG